MQIQICRYHQHQLAVLKSFWRYAAGVGMTPDIAAGDHKGHPYNF